MTEESKPREPDPIAKYLDLLNKARENDGKRTAVSAQVDRLQRFLRERYSRLALKREQTSEP